MALVAPGANASTRSWQYVQAVCATCLSYAPTGTAASALDKVSMRNVFGQYDPFAVSDRQRMLQQRDMLERTGWAEWLPGEHACQKGGPCVCKGGCGDKAGSGCAGKSERCGGKDACSQHRGASGAMLGRDDSDGSRLDFSQPVTANAILAQLIAISGLEPAHGELALVRHPDAIEATGLLREKRRNVQVTNDRVRRAFLPPMEPSTFGYDKDPVPDDPGCVHYCSSPPAGAQVYKSGESRNGYTCDCDGWCLRPWSKDLVHYFGPSVPNLKCSVNDCEYWCHSFGIQAGQFYGSATSGIVRKCDCIGKCLVHSVYPPYFGPPGSRSPFPSVGDTPCEDFKPIDNPCSPCQLLFNICHGMSPACVYASLLTGGSKAQQKTVLDWYLWCQKWMIDAVFFNNIVGPFCLYPEGSCENGATAGGLYEPFPPDDPYTFQQFDDASLLVQLESFAKQVEEALNAGGCLIKKIVVPYSLLDLCPAAGPGGP